LLALDSVCAADIVEWNPVIEELLEQKELLILTFIVVYFTTVSVFCKCDGKIRDMLLIGKDLDGISIVLNEEILKHLSGSNE